MHLGPVLVFMALLVSCQNLAESRVLDYQALYDVQEVPDEMERRMVLPILLQALLRTRVEDQDQRVAPSDVRAVKRQRQCFWSAVTCY